MFKNTQSVEAVVAQTITATGASAAFDNLCGDNGRMAVVEMIIAGPVTGTTPSMTVSVQGSIDGTNWDTIASYTAQTAATGAGVALRLALTSVLEPQLRVSWTVSGTTPSFGAVSVWVLFSDDEA